MRLALRLAALAGAAGEIPVGCVVTNRDGAVIGTGHNRRESDRSAVAHAEILAIEAACRALGNWRLDDCSLYVTLEPCPMCAGAILNARISRVFYGTRDRQTGACGGVLNLFMEPFDHTPQLTGGVLEADCTAALQAFFKTLRR